MNCLKRVRGYVVCLAAVSTALAGGTEARATPLDDYVNAPDAAYSWSLENTVPGSGFTDYVLRLTSQAWLTLAEVDQPVWEHWLTLTVPDVVSSTIGLVEIHAGNSSQTLPGGNATELRTIALSSGTVTARLRQVPNQPLNFGQGPMSEDAQIAYAWRQFLETGETKWLSRLPMTKSVVRAMDAITEFMASAAGGEIDVSDFVVMGASKRGWTTWTTAAVDDRVVAIAPLVIDLLNIDPSFLHHYWALGRYAPAIQDYVNEDITAWMGTPEWRSLVDIVEPFSYRNRLDMPKYIVNSSGDQFFLPDSSQFYFRQLIGEKTLRYVPNTGHGLNSIAVDDLEAWYWSIVNDVPRPEIKWKKEDTGELIIETVSGTPTQVRLWQATNSSERDFNISHVGAIYTDTPLNETEPGKYIASVPDPVSGWTAFFAEFTYDVGGPKLLRLTTEISVVPDVLPFGPRYKLGAATELVSQDYYDDGWIALWGSLNNAGTTVAYHGIRFSPELDHEIFLVDLGQPASWRQLTTGMSLDLNNIEWSSDDSAIFNRYTRIEVPTGEMSTPTLFGFELNRAVITARSDNNWLINLAGPEHTNNESRNLVAIPVHPDGSPDDSRSPVVLTSFSVDALRGEVTWLAINASGTQIAFVDQLASFTPGVPDTGDVYLLDAIDMILGASQTPGIVPGSFVSALAPTSLEDPRIHPVRRGGIGIDNIAHTPAFSQDGSVLLFSEDWNNVYRGDDFFGTVADGEWDVMVSRVDNVGGDVRIENPGNEGVARPTTGGTRMLYIAAVDHSLDLHLFITTLEVMTPVTGLLVGDPADNDILTFQTQHTQDASGTRVRIPAGTLIDFPPGVDQEVVIQTPIDPIDEPALPPGNMFAMPVVRTFGPAGTTFDPPITVTITYTDQEVAHIPDEEQIEVFLFNEVSGIFDIPVTVTARDTVRNTISFQVDHFSTFGLGGETDTDGDGMPDVWEIEHGLDPNEPSDAALDADGDGLTNLEEYEHGTDPNNPDTSGNGIPDGWLVEHGLNPLIFIVAEQDPDGDGFTNLEEFEAGSDPNDPDSTPLTVGAIPSVPPGAPVSGGLVAAAALVILGAAAIRRKRRQ